MSRTIAELTDEGRAMGPAAPDRDRRRSPGIWGSEYADYARMSDEVRARRRHHLDLRYGPDPRHLLDVYLPDGDVTDAPVLVFFHGGALEEGHPRRYGFLAEPYIARGAIFVSAGYRLLPDEVAARRDAVEQRIGALVHSLAGEIDPDAAAVRHATAQAGVDAATDGRAAIAWVVRHIGAFGGDPARLTVSGHSSGALIAVAAGASGEWQEAAGVPRDAVSTIVPIGGRYGLWLAGAIISGRSIDDPPREWALTASPRAVVVFGEQEFDGLDEEVPERATHCAEIGRSLVAALRARGSDAREIGLSPRGHWQTLRSLADEDDRTLPAVLEAMGVAR